MLCFLKNIFATKIGGIIQKFDHNIVFEKNVYFFRQKPQKNVDRNIGFVRETPIFLGEN
jgi:hypothetical protein